MHIEYTSGERLTDDGDLLECEDHQHDFSGITFPGIDEVWAVTFGDGKLTVLRVVGSNAHWTYNSQLTPQTG